jgi:hypothetical protein
MSSCPQLNCADALQAPSRLEAKPDISGIGAKTFWVSLPFNLCSYHNGIFCLVYSNIQKDKQRGEVLRSCQFTERFRGGGEQMEHCHTGCSPLGCRGSNKSYFDERNCFYSGPTRGCEAQRSISGDFGSHSFHCRLWASNLRATRALDSRTAL